MKLQNVNQVRPSIWLCYPTHHWYNSLSFKFIHDFTNSCPYIYHFGISILWETRL